MPDDTHKQLDSTRATPSLSEALDQAGLGALEEAFRELAGPFHPLIEQTIWFLEPGAALLGWRDSFRQWAGSVLDEANGVESVHQNEQG